MSAPRWLLEGDTRCPIQAADVDRSMAAFKALRRDAPIEEFAAAWLRCERAMRSLKAAWRALEPAK